MNKNIKASKQLFFTALGIDIVATIAIIFSNLWLIGVLDDISNGYLKVDATLISKIEFWDDFPLIAIATMVFVGVALVKWLNSCYRHARENIGASGFKNENWTVGSWIIPVFNLFKPYQIINEIYKSGSSAYRTAEGWKQESMSILLLIWWIFYAVIHLIAWSISRWMIQHGASTEVTIPEAIGLAEAQIIVCGFSIVIAVLWFFVANKLTQRLLMRDRTSPDVSNFELVGDLPPSEVEEPSSKVPDSIPLQVTQNQLVHDSKMNHDDVSQSQSFCVDDKQDTLDENAMYASAWAEVESGGEDKGLWADMASPVNDGCKVQVDV